MASTSNNSSFSLYTGGAFSDKIYQQSSLVNTYIDPANQTTSQKATVTTRVNIDSGDVELYHKLPAGQDDILLSTFKSDGTSIIPDQTKYDQFFSSSHFYTQKQADALLNDAKIAGLANAKINLPDAQYQALKSQPFYLGASNASTIDPQNVAAGNASIGQGNAAYNARQVPTGKKLMRYPLSIPDLGYDFIKITAYKYVTGGREALKLKNKKSAKERLLQNNTPLETIILPMQPNFSESNAVNWGGDNIDPLKLIAAQGATGLIQAIGNLADTSNGFAKSRQIVGDTFTTLGDEIKALLADQSTGPALTAYFAGQAVGANILGRTAGVTLNPNLELLFKGPNLRTFAFNFRFTPRSKEEAREVKEIIRVFKKNMAVQRSYSNLFLLTPNIFTVEYIYNENGSSAGQQHPYLNIFKPMAMTNLNVNYTPDGTYMTYNDGGSLTQYDLQMSFGEIEPIYADEYDSESDGDVGRFNEHQNMGY